jgi:[acyl-carrier-protein] S-malonyltransferase
MGRDLYGASAAAREIFDLADATLGFAVTRLCFEGPEEALTATENAQPALLAVSAALLAAIAEQGGEGVKGRTGEEKGAPSPHHLFTPSHTAGHSLGEYSALVAAGAIDIPTALRLVRRRGELMSEAREGGMAAIIGMDEAPLEQICREASAEDAPVVIANYNSPGP